MCSELLLCARSVDGGGDHSLPSLHGDKLFWYPEPSISLGNYHIFSLHGWATLTWFLCPGLTSPEDK